ncbi:hypothetical protein KFK09_007744 [Dendrobium nobile]|uniref:Uncharacterized protein n=1 Tax=Dendrobium nobile TaxID=94219 RepID=A0A8T3BXQ0_DENNO|nr:hypothetical protein KFK09_007744 [Dendrobium nobile]
MGRSTPTRAIHLLFTAPVGVEFVDLVFGLICPRAHLIEVIGFRRARFNSNQH